jgi:N-acetyl-gamma-glutamyl-phosphate reductase
MNLQCQDLDSFIHSNEKVDFVFLALPHTLSMQVTPKFLDKGIRVIDLSGDYRLPQPQTYEKWYGKPHQDIQNLKKAVYGLPEFFRSEIKKAQLVSNPGCYPTATCLGLAPALDDEWIQLENIMIDAKSGVSGAGRSPSLATHFPEVYENMKAYKIAVHQHTPEIERILSHWAGQEVKVVFVPHLIPVERGILCTIYGNLKRKAKTSEVLESFRAFYKNETFIRILPEGQFPQTRSVVDSNYCDIGLQVDDRTGKMVIVSVIDNMVKGASGQAVQNMNLMSGFSESLGLL